MLRKTVSFSSSPRCPDVGLLLKGSPTPSFLLPLPPLSGQEKRLRRHPGPFSLLRLCGEIEITFHFFLFFPPLGRVDVGHHSYYLSPFFLWGGGGGASRFTFFFFPSPTGCASTDRECSLFRRRKRLSQPRGWQVSLFFFFPPTWYRAKVRKNERT